MPFLQILSPLPSPPPGALDRVCAGLAPVFGIAPEHVWALWVHTPAENASRHAWNGTGAAETASPIVVMQCKSVYRPEQVREALLQVRDRLGQELGCDPNLVFITVQRVHPGHLYTRGCVWQGGEVSAENSRDTISLQPVGWVHCERVDPVDDHWSGVVSTIEVDPQTFSPEALAGLDEFSHLEVVYFFHRVPPEKIEFGARHPRNNPDWPCVGVFAQRGKNRPNRIGVSRCQLISVRGLTITVQGLDAIDGTPVLDIKPYFREFAPRGPEDQPSWVTDLMRNYY